MPPPSIPNDPFEALVARALELIETGNRTALDELLATHPEHAGAVQARLQKLGDMVHKNVGSDDALSAVDPQRLLGPYRILRELGSGGMGTVYLAEQKSPIRRRVALKVIKLGMDTKQVIARFEAERQALAMMEHDHIARVLEAGTTDTGQPYFAMDYVRGEPISDYCDHNRLTIEDRIRLLLQVCSAVQHSHAKGVIHRDLKPSNVLVTEQDGKPSAKVIDFGLARATDHRLVEATIFTEQGVFIGTPEYMSPEQAGLGNLDIDARTDVYSLGVMLYELLSGHLPFSSDELRRGGLFEAQRLIREHEPPSPSKSAARCRPDSEVIAKNRQLDSKSLRSRLRGELDWVVLRAIEKVRTRRYGTVAELAQDLQRYLDKQPVLARPPGPWRHLCSFAARRSPLEVATVSLLGAACLVLVLLLTTDRDGTGDGAEATHGEGPAVQAQNDPEDRPRPDDAPETARVEPGWELVRTNNFIALHRSGSNSPDLRAFAELATRRLEDGHGRYWFYLPRRDLEDREFVLRVFEDREEYARRGAVPGIGLAHYRRVEREVYLLHDSATEDPEASMRAVLHEGWHQFADWYFGGAKPHLWFDEGMGDFFGCHTLTDGAWHYETDKNKYRSIRSQVARKAWIPLREFVTWDQSRFYSARAVDHYAQGYSLVDFLCRGKGQMGSEWDAAWDPVIERYVALLMVTKDAAKANLTAFVDIDFDKLERAWLRWILEFMDR